jgi:hypothetical protein
MSAQLKLDSSDILIESRLTKSEILTSILKEEISDIKRDVRWLIGIVLTFNLTMIGIMIKGFHLL